MMDGILQGITTAITPANLALVFAGCLAGTVIGMIPGLGPMMAIAVMVPLTFSLDPSGALILMAGVYYGAVFGGSTSSILINAPGVPSAIPTTFDGYPLAKQGNAGKALAIAAYSSFAGGVIAAILLIASLSFIAPLALYLQSPEYLALMILSIVLVAVISSAGRPLKSMLMAVFGLMLATIGADPLAGVERYTFGNQDLVSGLNFLMLVMAIFALGECLRQVLESRNADQGNEALASISFRDLKVSAPEALSLAAPVGRSSFLGFIVGVIPGAGATIAAFFAYASEKMFARGKDRDAFGKGSLKGLAAPESANNAASTGSFVPLLSFGVPGSGTTALILGVLISIGVQPGPLMMKTQPDIFWGFVISMFVGNIVLLALNLPLIPYLARLIAFPEKLLIPQIVFFTAIGVFVSSFSVFDVHMIALVASGALLLAWLDFPLAPLAIAFILGDTVESNLRRCLIIFDGEPGFLWNSPFSVLCYLIVIAMLVWPIAAHLRKRQEGQTGAKPASP